MTDGVVTVCIPAYQAEGFIDRTLRCARTQTYERQRIVVAIDRSEDGTEEICRAHAAEDDRVGVLVHREQQGWYRNVNSLLDRAGTEYHFVYFHDDVIEPTYCAELVGALGERAGATSSHCDVVLDRPAGESLRRGCDYEGSAVERLLNHFVNPDRGALLRSMVRTSSAAGGLRMSSHGVQYEMALVAAGPAVHVAKPLYRRIDQRVGGLTESFRQRPFTHFVVGVEGIANLARDLVDELQPEDWERELLEYGLAIYITSRLRFLEGFHQAPGITPLEDVLGPTASLSPPGSLDRIPPSLAATCRRGQQRAERMTAKRAERLGLPS
jgi:glycosyltransferase involved in cell wall biosynthesis